VFTAVGNASEARGGVNAEMAKSKVERTAVELDADQICPQSAPVMSTAVRLLEGKTRGRFSAAVSSPATLIILLLIPLMLLELVGLAAEGRKRYGTFEGAIFLMAAALALVWNVIGGAVMYLVRKPVRELVRKSRLSRGATFVLFATLLALLEEVVTTTLTNLAPVFGSAQAFITASRNYLEVVIWHSVIVIAPMFVVWAWLLARFRFSPGSVFLLFGINGVLAELLIGGPALLMAPFWIFVYGLMIFLPAYGFPISAEAPAPRWYHYPAAIGACLLASAAVALPVNLLAPHLPHFGTTLTFPGP
jgi:hypothetical protein